MERFGRSSGIQSYRNFLYSTEITEAKWVQSAQVSQTGLQAQTLTSAAQLLHAP